jgi:hypothetical protein
MSNENKTQIHVRSQRSQSKNYNGKNTIVTLPVLGIVSRVELTRKESA